MWGVRGRAISHPRPVVLSGVRPGPTTHWLWVRGMRAWGPVTNPTARALASWLCALWGRHEGARGGAPPAWVWGVRGRVLSHPRPLVLCGMRPGPNTNWLRVRGVRALGPVTNPTARTLASWLCVLWGRHEGARGGAPLAWVWGVRGRALSHPRPLVRSGVRPGPTTDWLWMRGVRAWGPVTNLRACIMERDTSHAGPPPDITLQQIVHDIWTTKEGLATLLRPSTQEARDWDAHLLALLTTRRHQLQEWHAHCIAAAAQEHERYSRNDTAYKSLRYVSRILEDTGRRTFHAVRTPEGGLTNGPRDRFVVYGKKQETNTGSKPKMPDHYRCTITCSFFFVTQVLSPTQEVQTRKGQPNIRTSPSSHGGQGSGQLGGLWTKLVGQGSAE